MKEDDQDSWIEILYLRYSTDLFRFLFSILCDRYQAEDLMQEVFLKAWQKHPRFQNDKAEKVWLFRVARNLAMDVFRRNKHETVGIPETMPEDNPNVTDSVLSTRELLLMIDALKEPDREIVRLKLIGQLSHQEIARVMNRSVHSVKKRYERAIESLRKMFEEE
ncbi:MAG: sigma-70 family RNA polymerase sigma factor [Lachnospiraceae bacterium]|nr:sigma-70 family RNA polymerase sigma factor [Lachnospiraceae bacterium]